MDSAGLRKTRRPLVARGATAGRQHGCPFDTLISPGPWTCRATMPACKTGSGLPPDIGRVVKSLNRPTRTALIASGAARTGLI